MSKFNTGGTYTAPMRAGSPVRSEAHPTGHTYEGGAGYNRILLGELFLLAVSNMVGEDTFYETAGRRDDRYTQLIHQAAIEAPEWTVDFLRWLRNDANMRSASLVGAAEFAKARLDGHYHGFSRQAVDAVLQRPDEPGEMLAYWTSRYGRAIPKPVKRGVADAAARMYTERAWLKWDSPARNFRFADVLELTHAGPDSEAWWQGDLFRHTINHRHGHTDSIPATLHIVRANRELRADVANGHLGALLHQKRMHDAGLTWEDVLSLAGPHMDKRELWERLIPNMGYMALLRNLRNFDQAGVSDAVAKIVADRLADPDQVKRCRQFPMAFLSAYRAAPSLRWAWPLEQAIGHSLANVPELPGRTLILVDTSSSMEETFSRDGSLMRWDAAAVFGLALAQRCAAADVVSFSSNQRYVGDPPGPRTRVFTSRPGESLLFSVERWKAGGFFLGGGTDTAGAVRQHLHGSHDRVVILTDEQAADGDVGAMIPAGIPLYTWNLAGYEHGHARTGIRNRHVFGGLTDTSFRMIPLLEAGQTGTWPWQAGNAERATASAR